MSHWEDTFIINWWENSSDMSLNILCQENRFTKTLTLHGSIIPDGFPNSWRAYTSPSCPRPEIHSSRKGKCSSSVTLTGNTPICMAVHTKENRPQFFRCSCLWSKRYTAMGIIPIIPKAVNKF